MRLLMITGLFAAALAAAAPAQDEKKDEPPAGKKEPPSPTEPPATDPKATVAPQIEGGYTIAAAERDGQPLPLTNFDRAVVRVVGGRIIGTDRDRREFLVATYVLDDRKKPWELNMKMLVVKEHEVRGLVKKDGPMLTLIHALPGGPAPTEFKTQKGQQMFVLRGFVLDPVPPPNKFSSSQ
jgi:uncharacterized protein (TIGR03067 family)